MLPRLGVASEVKLAPLSSWVGVTKQAAAKVVDEMVARDLVGRVPDPDDARAKLLRLTPRARAVMAAALRGGALVEQRLAADVGDRSVRALRRALVQLILTAGADEELRERRSRALW